MSDSAQFDADGGQRRARRTRGERRAAFLAEPARLGAQPRSTIRSRPATRTRSGRSRCRCGSRSRTGSRLAPGRGLPRRPRGDLRDQRSGLGDRDRHLARPGPLPSAAGRPDARLRAGGRARRQRRRRIFARCGWSRRRPPLRGGPGRGRHRRAGDHRNRRFTTVVVDPGAAPAATASGSLSMTA